jgi:hypothetical protein
VVIGVDHNGRDIPREGREKVFAAFYRLARSRNCQSGGGGLGLSPAGSHDSTVIPLTSTAQVFGGQLAILARIFLGNASAKDEGAHLRLTHELVGFPSVERASRETMSWCDSA